MLRRRSWPDVGPFKTRLPVSLAGSQQLLVQLHQALLVGRLRLNAALRLRVPRLEFWGQLKGLDVLLDLGTGPGTTRSFTDGHASKGWR